MFRTPSISHHKFVFLLVCALCSVLDARTFSGCLFIGAHNYSSAVFFKCARVCCLRFERLFCPFSLLLSHRCMHPNPPHAHIERFERTCEYVGSDTFSLLTPDRWVVQQWNEISIEFRPISSIAWTADWYFWHFFSPPISVGYYSVNGSIFEF